MLLMEPTSSPSSQHYLCLDLLSATFEGPAPVQTGSAILLEIWETGGLLQTGFETPPDYAVCLSSSQGTVLGRVASCVEDEYGYLVEFAVDSPKDWFPEGYRPPYLVPVPAAAVDSTVSQPAAAADREPG
jgi:hypothetical protein